VNVGGGGGGGEGGEDPGAGHAPTIPDTSSASVTHPGEPSHQPETMRTEISPYRSEHTSTNTPDATLACTGHPLELWMPQHHVSKELIASVPSDNKDVRAPVHPGR